MEPVISVKFRMIHPQGKHPSVPFEKGNGYAPETVWTFSKWDKVSSKIYFYEY